MMILSNSFSRLGFPNIEFFLCLPIIAGINLVLPIFETRCTRRYCFLKRKCKRKITKKGYFISSFKTIHFHKNGSIATGFKAVVGSCATFHQRAIIDACAHSP